MAKALASALLAATSLSCAVHPPFPEPSAAYSLEVVSEFGEGVLVRPGAIAVDWEGVAFVCDRGANRVVSFGPDGSLRARSGGFGAASALFDGPSDVALEGALSVVVADRGNRRVQRFDRDLNFAGVVPESRDVALRMGRLTGVAGARGGDLWIADADERTLFRLDAFGTRIIAGDELSLRGRLVDPRGIATDEDDFVYVADGGTRSVSVYDNLGGHSGDVGAGVLSSPVDVAVRRGVVAVADEQVGLVLFDLGGRMLRRTGGANPVGRPSGVAFDDQGRLYVSDPSGRVVVMVVRGG